MMLFFIGNAIEGQLISTGAFEITFNGMLRSLGHNITRCLPSASLSLSVLADEKTVIKDLSGL